MSTSTGFYRYCAPDASAPVVVINESPSNSFATRIIIKMLGHTVMLLQHQDLVQALPNLCENIEINLSAGFTRLDKVNLGERSSHSVSVWSNTIAGS